MRHIQRLLTERGSAAVERALGITDADPIVRPSPPERDGDYQLNAAMSFAKPTQKSPRDVAQSIVDALEVDDLASEVSISGPGFVNVRLRDEFLLNRLAETANDERLGVELKSNPDVVVLDYAGPNVAKEMHVGHLRSTVIGDALVRVLRFIGDTVQGQDHIGDWGTQFGMLLAYMRELESEGEDTRSRELSDLNALYRKANERFRSDESFAEQARKDVVALQSGEEWARKTWQELFDASEEHFRRVYARLGVLLTDEDIRGESFYNDMLDGIVAELESKGLAREDQGAIVVYPKGFTGRDGEPMPFIIRKKEGGYNYATTDLATLRYSIEQLQATRLVYVTDARQSQHFAMVFEVCREAGWLPEDVEAVHVGFGSILGPDGKPFKTRSGETVRLERLLDEAVERASVIVKQKNPELGEKETTEIARVVGIGAIKYGDLSSDAIKDYVFSWERMLAFDGNTAPYLQYAFARIASIFRKAELDHNEFLESARWATEFSSEYERILVLHLLRFSEVVEAVEETLAPHRMCTYLFELGTTFTSFYENCPVLTADSEELRNHRLALSAATAQTLRQGLDLLGIEVLERM